MVEEAAEDMADVEEEEAINTYICGLMSISPKPNDPFEQLRRETALL